ncbi:MAG: IS5 family transposase [Nodosilinea sp.]|jgi:IS5 family transposase
MAKGFGRVQKRRQALEKSKDRLSELNAIIPWAVFRSCLEQLRPPERKSNAGRKPIDQLMLFKLLILQQLYNLSDEELEYQTHDRTSFRRFLGLSPEAEVPDAKTIWLFRQRLTEAGLIEELFQQFEQYLQTAGYEAKGGQIIDATIIPVPVQRNSREENKQIKNGEIPAEWKEEPDKLAQKDVDARWTKKNGKSYYGYKNHINVDVAHGFIRQHSVTDAAVHDSQELDIVLDPDNADDEVWADSAYRSEEIERTLEIEGYESQIHEKANRNSPLSEEQKAANREKSQTRAKVEHVFGCWVTSMGGKMVRCIGLERVSAYLGLKDLTFNLKRYVFWQKREKSQAQCV